MDPGWPYTYNRLVAATSGQSAGNFAHITAGGSVPGIVQPTATVPGTVNPYGTTTFLPPPPTVGYDVFSTLFHPHAAQVSSPAAAVNLKTLNYSIDSGQGRASAQQESASNATSSNSSPQTQSQQPVTQQQFTYQNTSSISRPTANVSWNASTNSSSGSGSSNSGSAGGGSQISHQQLQFGLIPNSVSSASSTSNPALATITRVNSNGCAGTTAVSTPSSIYDYNAQLKAHPLYQLNSHLANAAVMAMANKLNANRTTLSVPLAASPANSNNGSSCSGTSSNNNGGSSGSYSSSNDREKTQHQQQSQDYANHSSVNKSSHINAASSTVAAATPSPSNSSTAIPLIQFEAVRLQQQLQLQQQQQQQAAKESVQQSNPISYSMWANNSPIQNKFSSCEVAQQQQQQQQQQIQQQQNSRRPPMHSPNPVQSAFTRQTQQSDVSIRSQQQQQQHQEALYLNQRGNKNTTTAEYSNSPSSGSDHQSSSSSRNQQANTIVVPRRPSPMQMQSQASPIGQSASSPAYPIYNSPMNPASNNQQQHQQHQYSSNNNSRDSSSADGHYQVSAPPPSKTREVPPANNYSTVITRVAGGGNAWDQSMGNKSTAVHQQLPAEPVDNRINKAPKKRRPTAHEEQEAVAAAAAVEESNRTTWQHQLHLLGSQSAVKSAYESSSPASSNGGGGGHSINRSALAQQQHPDHQQQHHIHHHNHQQSQQHLNHHQTYAGAAAADNNWRTEEEERRRAEVAKSQVVVPDIMEELNFLTADAIKSAGAKKATSPQKAANNGRVQIISVESTAGKSSGAGHEDTSTAKGVAPVNAKKPEEKGFIGSYLKFLQGETNPLGVPSVTTASKPRRVTGVAGQTQPKKRNNASAQKQQQNQQQQQSQSQQSQQTTDQKSSSADAATAKKMRPDADDQGYVPNGGASAFDPNYHQQALHQQSAYQQPYMHHPLSIAGAHFQGQVPTNSVAVGGAQMLAHQAYASSGGDAAAAAPPVTDGFNYFDLQFRPRW